MRNMESVDGAKGTETWNQSMELKEFMYLQMKVFPSNVGKHRVYFQCPTICQS